MSNSTSSFSKFILKPSSLSKLTENFNKVLEETPVPKIEGFELKHLDETLKINPISNETLETQFKTEEKEQIKPFATSTNEFIFGEKLCERVVNVQNKESPEQPVKSDTKSEQTSVENNDASDEQHKSSDVEQLNTSKYSALDAENEAFQTILKFNCKLYILEPAKSNWVERGYGILKMFESNDKTNYKIMMWTDKCFRLILNTKLFENMVVDKANAKSIRFNGFDNGTVRIFLVKTSNANDCEDLYEMLSKKISELKNSEKSEIGDTSVLLSCDCLVHETIDTKKIIPTKCQLEIYENKNNPNEEILIRINSTDRDKDIYLKTQLSSTELTNSNRESVTFKFEDSGKHYNVIVSNEEDIEDLIDIYAKYESKKSSNESFKEEEKELEKPKTKRSMDSSDSEDENDDDDNEKIKKKTKLNGSDN